MGQSGKKLGKTKGWIGFPVPEEGTTDDIVVTSNEIGMRNSKFCGLCFSLRTADVFPVLSLSLRRERSDDQKYARLQLAVIFVYDHAQTNCIQTVIKSPLNKMNLSYMRKISRGIFP